MEVEEQIILNAINESKAEPIVPDTILRGCGSRDTSFTVKVGSGSSLNACCIVVINESTAI